MQPTSAALTPWPTRRQQQQQQQPHHFSNASSSSSLAASGAVPLPDMTSVSALQHRRHCNDPTCICHKRTPSSPRPPPRLVPCVAAAAADPVRVAACPDRRRHCHRWCAAWSAIYHRHPNPLCPVDKIGQLPICWYWLYRGRKPIPNIISMPGSTSILLTILGHNLLAIH